MSGVFDTASATAENRLLPTGSYQFISAWAATTARAPESRGQNPGRVKYGTSTRQ